VGHSSGADKGQFTAAVIGRSRRWLQQGHLNCS